MLTCQSSLQFRYGGPVGLSVAIQTGAAVQAATALAAAASAGAGAAANAICISVPRICCNLLFYAFHLLVQ